MISRDWLSASWVTACRDTAYRAASSALRAWRIQTKACQLASSELAAIGSPRPLRPGRSTAALLGGLALATSATFPIGLVYSQTESRTSSTRPRTSAQPVTVSNSTPISEVEASTKDLVTQCTVQVLDQVSVSAQEAGQLLNLELRENAQVEEGQPLARIDDVDVQLALELATHEWEAAKFAAESDIEVIVAEKSREVAKAAEEDAVKANARSTSRIFTDSEMRRRKFEVERAVAQIDFSRFEKQQAAMTEKVKEDQMKRAKAALVRHQVLAPLSGEVVEILKHNGEWVNPGDAILRIVRMDKLKVEGFVNVADWPRSALIGRPIEITVYAPGGQQEKFRSTVARISASTVGADQYTIWAEIDNRRDGNTWLITPGLTAEINMNP